MVFYDKLMDTISEIISNDNIMKDGLVLTYYIKEKEHKKIDEHLYISDKDNQKFPFKHKNVIEININEMTVKLIKKDD